jgi:uncharacterized membrane protein
LNARAPGTESTIARRLRFAAVFATLLLGVLLIRWIGAAASTPRVIVGALLALPFASGVRFLIAGHRRTFAWLTLALAPPLVLGLMEAVADPGTRLWSTILVFTVLVTFALFVAYLRATRPSSPS